MATFKNARAAITTGTTTPYTCPAGQTALVILAQVANVDGLNGADVTVWWTDASAADAVTHLTQSVTVPAQSALAVLAGKLVLEPGDAIRTSASASGDLEISISVVEIG